MVLRCFCTLPAPTSSLLLPRRSLSTWAPLRVAFFGSDDVSLASLRLLHESLQGRGAHSGLVSQLDVICPGDRPSGRGRRLTMLPVTAFAREHNLRTLHIAYGTCVGVGGQRLRGHAWR